MGLDMFAYKVKKENSIDDFHIKYDENNVEKIHYWRKHPNLHGWFEELYRYKGGLGEFNCVYIKINLIDLMDLEDDIKNHMLPETTGFFFGSDEPFDIQTEYDDLEFVKTARKAINEGYDVYYSSWW